MRFFITAAQAAQDHAWLSPEDSAHLCRVLRRRAGDKVTLCDGCFDYLGEITVARPDGAQVRLLERRQSRTEPSACVTLYAGLAKGPRFDWMVQKAVELGVSHIVPVHTRYCVVKPRDFEKKIPRLQKIAREACMQSNRSRLVEVSPILEFADAVEQASQASCPLFLYEKEGRRSFSQALRGGGGGPYAVVSGPEGGFSPEEVELAASRGLWSVSLGPRILRCETAPLAALCAILYESSNFDIIDN